MRFLRRSLTGLFLMGLTFAILAVAVVIVRSAAQERAAREAGAMPARERVFAVSTVTVEPTTLAPVMEAFGEIQSRRELELRAPVGGRIVALGENFVEGGRVAAGEMLVELDDTDFAAALALAETDFGAAEAEVRDADAALGIAGDDLASAEEQAELRRAALARQRDLADRGVGTEAAVETAALAAASAEQAVLSRRSALATAQTRVSTAKNTAARAEVARNEARRTLDDATITADFAGALSGVSAIEGRIVTANEQLATLVDPTALEVAFRLSTAQYARLLGPDGTLARAEVTARLAVEGVALTATGTIARESAEVGEGLTGRLVFARLTEAAGFRPGDFVTVEVREPELSGAALIPAAAVDGTGEVLVIGADDRLEAVAVEVLRRQGDSVLIAAGPLAGRAVVTERSPVLGAGIRVRQATRPDPNAAPVAPPAPAMIALDDARRARLIEFVTANTRMPAEAKARILDELAQPEVSAETIERLESRMGD